MRAGRVGRLMPTPRGTVHWVPASAGMTLLASAPPPQQRHPREGGGPRHFNARVRSQSQRLCVAVHHRPLAARCTGFPPLLSARLRHDAGMTPVASAPPTQQRHPRAGGVQVTSTCGCVRNLRSRVPVPRSLAMRRRLCSPVGNCHEFLQRNPGGAGFDGVRGQCRAVGEIGCLAGDDEGGRRIQHGDVA